MLKLPIKYDSALAIASFGDDPSAYTILSKFFSNYIQITEKGSHWTKSFSKKNKTIELNTKQQNSDYTKTLRTKEFIDLSKDLKNYKFIVHAPLSPPYKINPLRFLMNSPALSHAYENKRYFRDEFSEFIKIPEYNTWNIEQLYEKNAYSQLLEKFGSAFVIQDEESSGSMGTFIIRSEKDYSSSVNNLRKTSLSRSVVISKFQIGESTSVQVCITKYGVLYSGIQKQLVNDSSLCNKELVGANKWCGGEIGYEYPKKVQKQAISISKIIGKKLSSKGYKGIFGIDLIISPKNEVYAIEINARLTGYTHAVSEMQAKEGKIPFLLLHVLELANVPYRVTNLRAISNLEIYEKPLSYMILMNPSKKSIKLKNNITSGIYKVNGSLKFVKNSNTISDIKDENTILVQSTIYSKGDTIDSGKRILKIFRLGESMNGSDLNDENKNLIKVVKQTFDLP